MTPLEDISPCPFGAHKGKLMQDTPASWLHWVWSGDKTGNDNWMAVRDYIKRNLAALKKEHPDGIW